MGKLFKSHSERDDRTAQRLILLMKTLPYGVPENSLYGEITYANDALQNLGDEKTTTPLDSGPMDEIFGDDAVAKTNILHKFAAQAEQIVVEFEAAFKQHDTEKVSFHSHKLKSSARTVGANELADACLAMELAGRKADWKEINSLSPQMRPAMEWVRDYIFDVTTLLETENE